MSPSPAERFAASRRRAASPLLTAFRAGQRFELDPFQVEACESLEAGRSVLVAAPTGAGKTVVAEFAVHLAMLRPRAKLFYTTPIKALSNQKYGELLARYGPAEVGLLTGDANVNPHGRIVVMTTEVLRNMLYAGSDLLEDLAFVVMDEVHYLADRFRGAVWEEVIIHLPERVRLVSLSATVSNAEEFGQWLQTVHGPTDVVVSERRPTPLYHHVLLDGGLLDLFDRDGGRPPDPRVAPELSRQLRSASPQRSGRGRGRRAGRRGGRPSLRPGRRAPDRLRALETLERQGMLPAIWFIFSRSGCDDAVEQTARAGVRLTTPRERERIRRVAQERTGGLPGRELHVLGYWSWLDGLERGVAAHHAGMLPAFKEIVEELFQRRLLKLVFATETLALGINMPARTVVLEKLDKFNGEGRVPITPGEFTQLTGRAGRRGIDHEGHAVVLWREGMQPEAVANLAARRSYPLRSSFRPSYNMTVNLVERFGRRRGREVLESSFAQFQADRAVVDLARRAADGRRALAGYREALECDRGDFAEYAGIRRELSESERRRPPGGEGEQAERARREHRERIDRLRARLRRHPCHACPEREQHARWAERAWRLERETAELEERIEARTGAVARLFDRLAGMLERRGYIRAAPDGELEPTEHGRTLARIYGERDLLIAECLRSGAWAELDGAGLAAMVAALVFEPRRDDEDAPEYRLPAGAFRRAMAATEQLAEELAESEREARVPVSPPLCTALVPAMHLWARGGRLEDVLERARMQAGDFVRAGKLVLDVLDQLAQLPHLGIRGPAREASRLVRRGIIAHSGTDPV
ncbi:MAG: DEAD/DEAH box helicase [Pseudoclavibacter sp.]|nr:DEAD/DEAH box helicase [Pseudoclavibacter sp.]